MKYKAATPNIHNEPIIAAGLGHKKIVNIGGLKISTIFFIRIFRHLYLTLKSKYLRHINGNFLPMRSSF